VAWSVLQSKSAINAGTGNVAVTFTTANLSAGTKIIVWVEVSASTSPQTAVTAVKDGALNSWTQLRVASNNSSGAIFLYALDTPAGDVGTKPTITATINANFGAAILVQEVSGLLAGNTSAMLDGTPGIATGTTSPATTGALTTAAASEFLTVGYGDPGDSITVTTPGGWTADGQNVGPSTQQDLSVYYKNSTGAAESASLTLSGTAVDGWNTILAAFKLAATGAGGAGQARPGKTWLRRFHHRQVVPPVPAAAAAVTVPAVPQRPQIVPRPAALARIGPRGLCAAGIAVAAAVTVPAAAPPRPPGTTHRPPPARAHIGPQGRAGAGIASSILSPLGTPSRPRPFVVRSPAPSRGNAGPKPVTVVVTASQRPPPQARRPAPARGLWHGNAGPQPVTVTVVSYQRPPLQIPRQAPRRAVWRGFGSRVVAFPGTPGPLWRPQPRRPAPGRVLWRGGAGPQATVPVAPQAYQHPPPQARRPAPRRALWRGGAGPATPAVVTAVPRPLPLPRSKPPRRVLWHGNSGPQPAAVQAAAPPRWRPLPVRRKPARAVWRYILGLVNLPPPVVTGPWTLTAGDQATAGLTPGQSAAALTATDTGSRLTTAATSSALTATGAGTTTQTPAAADPAGHGNATDKPATTLTAGDKKTGGPGG
jgi:hypothetical protein